MELYELTVHELLDKLEKKEITRKEIMQSYIKRIEEKEFGGMIFPVLSDGDYVE